MNNSPLTKLYEKTLDMLQQSGVSGIVDKSLEKRYSDGDSTISLASANYLKRNNILELIFWANSSYGNESFVAATDLPQPPNGKYTLALRFYGVKNYLTKNVLSSGYSEIEKALKEIVHSCDVKFYSDDPSFFFQGCFEDLDKEDLSIYKFPGPDGKGIWRGRHYSSGGVSNPNIHLTKHLAQVCLEIDEFIRPMAQMLEIK